MTLELTCRTDVPEMNIDYITILAPDGTLYSLNWDASHVSRTPDGFIALCSDVRLDEKHATGKLAEILRCEFKNYEPYFGGNIPVDTALASEILTLRFQDSNGEQAALSKEQLASLHPLV